MLNEANFPDYFQILDPSKLSVVGQFAGDRRTIDPALKVRSGSESPLEFFLAINTRDLRGFEWHLDMQTQNFKPSPVQLFFLLRRVP